MKKMRKRALSLLLCFATLSGTILPAIHALAPFARAEEVKTSWDNGDMIEKGLCTDSGKYNFYGADTPFSYAFYYEGSGYEYGDYPNYYGEPDDRAPGFYPMTKGENAEDGWTYGFYHCGKDSTESKDFLRVRAVQQAAANAPFEKYSPGVVFTAPYSGMVEFVYQYAGAGGIDSNHTFYVMRESANGYEDAEQQYKATQIANFGGGGACDSATFRLNVTEGEKIYFVTDNAADKGMSAHWIKSARYLDTTPTYTVSTNQDSYTEGDTITVTSTVSEGGFSSKDTIQILQGSTVIAEQAVAEGVTFSGISAGSYQVALIHGGVAVATAEITVTAATIDPEVGYGNLTDHCGDENAKNRNFYPVDAPIGYAFYYQGTDPDDTRAAGFYDMVLANNGDGWSNGFYNCALNAGETAGPARVSSIHQASSCAPSFHYSPGFVYTAPETGMVEFVYQYTWLDGPPADANKMTFYIMRESATGYGDALYAYKPQKSVSGSNGSGTYDEATIKLNVTQGEKVYFVADNADNGSMVAHWIKSAAYVADPTYALETDKVSYTAGEDVTVTADVSAGGFSARDTIRLSKGSTMIEEKAAAAEVTFSNLSAGNYQVALIRGGNAVQTKNITVVPDPNTTSWDNGGIMAHYKDSHSFYIEGTPFGYAFYYEGTDPQDSRAKGFYPMIISENNDGWSHGYYNCAVNSGETGLSRVSTIHQAAANAPSWHYSPGMVFTAPKTGTVEFTYQFAKAYGGGGCDNHVVRVLRDVTDPYENGAIATYPLTATLYGEGEGASGTPETQTITVNVTQGEKIYFVIDNHDGNGGMSAHWIKSARYLDTTPTYTVSTNQDSYTEGDTITVTSTVSEGGFSATDKIQILNAGSSVAMEKAAAETVTFDPTAEQLPAGDYQVTLVHGGLAVATKEITVVAVVVPGPATSWNNGSMLEGGRLKTDAGKHQFLTEPFGYAFFYEGTDPDDTRLYGFHDMVLSSAGDQDWPKGFYACSPDVNSGTENQLKAIHQAAAAASTYHYSPGIVFTAPYTGTVKFVYQYAGLDGIAKDENNESKFTFYVMRDSAASYREAIGTYTPAKVASSDPNVESGGECTEVELTIPMTKGEKIYFVVDQEIPAGGGMVAHWIKSAGYLSVDSTYILETDKSAYNENEVITITTAVFEGKFSAEDVIRIVPMNQDLAVAEFAVSDVVTVTATPEQVPAGNYRVVLIHNGKEVAAKEIRVVGEGLPTESRWDNGDLPMRCTDAGKRVFYSEDTPFGYAFFYEGTDPEDPRTAGFYDMILAEAGDQDWPKGFYACGLTSGETKDGLIDNRLNTLHQAAANAPTYHYSPGVVFTAPYDGTVRFVYQYAGLDGVEDKFTFYVMRDSAKFYEDALYAYKPAKAVSSADGSGEYDEVTIEIGVLKGQKIYFVTDSTANGHMCAHWIKSAEYVSFEIPDIQAPTTVRPKPADSGSGTPGQRGPVTVFDGTAWESGDLLAHYKDTHSFYDAEGTPFGYAFYYEGTDPEDNRAKGFYTMQMSANQDGWSDGYYNCAMTPEETGFARVSTIHQAAANAPSFHYSPGFVFTAPATGVVEFTYQFAKAYGGGGCDGHIIYVLRDVEDPYDNGVITTFRPTAVISGEGAEAAGTPETQVFTVAVTEGEKIYFVIDNHDANGGMSAHWIKTAKYVSDEIPKEDDDLGDPEPPLSEIPDSADTNNDPTDNNKTFPSIAIWGGIALIAAIIAVAIVFMKKKKTADGEKEESKTGLPR